MGVEYPARIALAQLPTPLQPLERLSREISGDQRIWVKRDDLTGSVLSGNKVRKLEFVTAAARAQGCNTLISCGGVQSNHCRATALAGAQLGFRVHLILRGECPPDIDGNLLLNHLAGARISHYSPRQYSAQLDQLFAHWQAYYSDRGDRALCLPTGASDGIGIWGYIAAAEEMGRDFISRGIERAHVVCATGSGGTQAGLSLGMALHDVAARVWGINVCEDEAWFLNKVAADIADWQRRYAQPLPGRELDVNVIDGYVGPGYGRADAEVFDTISRLARLEGLILDPVYTGKAFHGMLEELRRGRFDDCDDIVFVHTGGTFGLFPQRRHFNFTPPS